MNSSIFVTWIIVIVITVGLSLVLRSVIIWYYKIDKMVENQQKQINLLTELLSITKKVNHYPE